MTARAYACALSSSLLRATVLQQCRSSVRPTNEDHKVPVQNAPHKVRGMHHFRLISLQRRSNKIRLEHCSCNDSYTRPHWKTTLSSNACQQMSSCYGYDFFFFFFVVQRDVRMCFVDCGQEGKKNCHSILAVNFYRRAVVFGLYTQTHGSSANVSTCDTGPCSVYS